MTDVNFPGARRERTVRVEDGRWWYGCLECGHKWSREAAVAAARSYDECPECEKRNE